MTYNDTAHKGHGPTEALEVALGDDEAEAEEEMTPEDMVVYLTTGPDNPITYDDVARWAGRGVLVYLIDHPEAVDLDAYTLFDAVFQRAADGSLSNNYPQLEGISGFMVGWAVNAARYAYGVGPTQNPALVEL